jgi:AraC-like DNA-binding protein
MGAAIMDEIPGLDLGDLKLHGFKVHQLPDTVNIPVSAGRRDFYKMGLVDGDMTVRYGDRTVELDQPVLFFVNPRIPHAVLRRSKRTTGYACLFTENFISGRDRTDVLKNSPLFQAGDSPVIPLNDEQVIFISGVFEKMLAVHDGDYYYKAELIRNCIVLILHEALRIQPSQNAPQFKNAAARLTHQFTDLLERQFPIERAGEVLSLRNARDYAMHLSVHVNYLNRSVKEVTGKPTTVHIAERIIAEAKALLQHTDWSVAEIAYALGFEYPTYFNNYFKRITDITPKIVRDKV